ncbi:hypothetical protein Q7P35_004856 [Cladosporium inversicolor]
MASASAANNTFQISDEVYDRSKAEYEAAVHEGGGFILKDYYTIFEYRDRRAKFFDKLPGWSRRPGDIYNLVKRDSNYFFNEDDPARQLDALEVRERELEHEFTILLPLPTTANTQTIDNFKTCPPIDDSREEVEVSEDEDEVMEGGDHEGDEAEDDYDEDVEDGRDVPTPGGSATRSTPVTSPIMSTNSDLNKKLALLNDPASIADLSDLATPMLPGRLTPSKPRVAPPQQSVPAPAVSAIQIRKKTTSPKDLSLSKDPASIANLSDLATPMLPGGLARSKPHMAPPQPPVSAPVDTIQTQKTTTSPKNFSVAPGVSSMARYGMPRSVKSQQRQHTPEQAKMTALKPTSASKVSKIVPNATTTNHQADFAEPAPKKKKLDHIAAKPAKAPGVPTSSQPAANNKQAATVPSVVSLPTTAQPIKNNKRAPAVASGTTKQTTSHSTTNNSQPTVVSSNAPGSAVAPTAAQLRLNDIITGRILPRSKQEAKDAVDEQHNRLLAAYRSQNQNQTQSNTRKSARQSIANTNSDPDFMPHYFSAANFAPVDPNADLEDDESGSVRCICGIIENDGKEMLQCETCEVWQHTACVFPTLDEDKIAKEKEKDFWCTVCDPYAHRHVLKDLRAGQSVGSNQSSKGAAKAKGKAKGKSKK